MYYGKIDKARKILGLNEKATLEQIRKAYRTLVTNNHPDKYFEKDKTIYERKMTRVNQAYKDIMEYVAQFEISFEKNIVEQYDPERAFRRFKDYWLER